MFGKVMEAVSATKVSHNLQNPFLNKTMTEHILHRKCGHNCVFNIFTIFLKLRQSIDVPCIRNTTTWKFSTRTEYEVAVFCGSKQRVQRSSSRAGGHFAYIAHHC